MKSLKALSEGIADLFFPACCPVCGRHLVQGEEGICLHCLADMPRLRFSEHGGNSEVEKLFLGSRIVESAVSMFRYGRLSPYSEILKDVKYRNVPMLAKTLGKCFAREIAETDFFADMDVIVPVPLYKRKMNKRGYNQSRFFADGLSEKSGLPVAENLLMAVRDHGSQTFLGTDARRRNVEGVFSANKEAQGKNIILADDVITTGSTLLACCDALQKIGVAKVKIISLAFANMTND